MDLLTQLLEAGLVQIGNFESESAIISAHLMFEMLPSYPQLISHIANGLADLISPSDYDYIVCPFDSIPLATLISQKHNIPLVYEDLRQDTAVLRLIGAYDVGHPSCLVCNIIQDNEHLAQDASKVGLDVKKVVGVVSLNESHMASSLFSYDAILKKLQK